jgi:hypothetical protein
VHAAKDYHKDVDEVRHGGCSQYKV